MVKMKSAFLLPFMGPLPPYFLFWAKSCEINKRDFHWFVYSDQVKNKKTVNDAVTLIPYTYAEMIADFKRLLDIDIYDANPRMLCNYRLFFYFLRRDYEDLDQFSYIGYTDMDMIYGDLSRFIPDNSNPFTLVRLDRVKPLSRVDSLRYEMTLKDYREFDESDAFIKIVSDGNHFWCKSDPLQPAMTPPFNHRKVFSIWKNGKVTIFDNRGHKKEGGFHHFSRYKNRKDFHVSADLMRNS